MYDSPAVPSVQTLPALQGSPTWGPMLLSAPHIMEETLHTLPVGLLVQGHCEASPNSRAQWGCGVVYSL